MTYIEFFDHAAVENICACLTRAPERVVLVGDDYDKLVFHCRRYEEIFKNRGFKVDFIPRATNENKLQNVLKTLSWVVETYDDCVFGLTGGSDLCLVAIGMISQKYPDKNIKMHRFNLESGKIYGCDQDGVTVAENRQPKLTVEENIRLYGGDVFYDDQEEDGTHIWDMNEDFRRDIRTMWRICCSHGNRLWNEQMNVIGAAVKARPIGLSVSAPRNAVEATLRREGFSMAEHKDLLDELCREGLLLYWHLDSNAVELEFKNDQIKRTMIVAGRALEMYVYLTALEAKDDQGVSTYNDAMTGVYIDWDGKPPKNGDEDSHNEIDVLLMDGVVPVFVSCKNGTVKVDELFKLKVVAEQFGSKHAKLVLVAPMLDEKKHRSQSMKEQVRYLKQRAEDMGIRVVHNLPGDDQKEANRIVRSFSTN